MDGEHMDGQDLCRCAIAYLVTWGSKEHPRVALPVRDAPVLTDLGNGLLVGYVVDHGAHFQRGRR
jgi:hypothetical protein